MSDELDEIREIFIEECKDGLSVMEKGLLQLDGGTLDKDAVSGVINEIFRAAHSIKGGGATFGFPEIAEFTHVLETLLGRLRDGSLPLDRAAIDLLLGAIDQVTAMVAGLAGQAGADPEETAQVRAAMEAFMAGTNAAPKPAPKPTPAQAEPPRPEPAVARPKAGSRAEREPAPDAAKHHDFIRVDIDKIDAMINLVGELIITQSMLTRQGEDIEGDRGAALRDALDHLRSNTRELQDAAMRIRMLPIDTIYQRFPRLVRDLAKRLGKQVELRLTGERTEVDKTVLEHLADPLNHLIRNALDHGIENPLTRRDSGKPETGLLEIDAYHRGGHVVVEIRDDGAGLNPARIFHQARKKGLVPQGAELSDEEIHRLIFLPGFSTATVVSDVSGRGVGMDVVVRNIERLGGSVQIETAPGMGCRFILRLPLTLSILDGQLARVGDDIYVLPLLSIIESVQVRGGDLHTIGGRDEMFLMRGRYIPVLHLGELFGATSGPVTRAGHRDGLLVVVESDGRAIGLLVDALLGQQQVVLKSLEKNYRQVPGMQGATILGDGRVALIVDTATLASMHRNLTDLPPSTLDAA